MTKLAVDLSWDNLDQAFSELEKDCTEVVRGITVELWNSILIKTPQYFGGMAASWNYTYNKADVANRTSMIPARVAMESDSWFSHSPTRRGDPFAIGIANAASAGKDASFKLGKMVYINNGVFHDEGEYSAIIESYEPTQLRTFNRPGKPVHRSLDMIATRYGQDVSRNAAAYLKNLKIGG